MSLARLRPLPPAVGRASAAEAPPGSGVEARSRVTKTDPAPSFVGVSPGLTQGADSSWSRETAAFRSAAGVAFMTLSRPCSCRAPGQLGAPDGCDGCVELSRSAGYRPEGQCVASAAHTSARGCAWKKARRVSTWGCRLRAVRVAARRAPEAIAVSVAESTSTVSVRAAESAGKENAGSLRAVGCRSAGGADPRAGDAAGALAAVPAKGRLEPCRA